MAPYLLMAETRGSLAFGGSFRPQTELLAGQGAALRGLKKQPAQMVVLRSRGVAESLCSQKGKVLVGIKRENQTFNDLLEFCGTTGIRS